MPACLASSVPAKECDPPGSVYILQLLSVVFDRLACRLYVAFSHGCIVVRRYSIPPTGRQARLPPRNTTKAYLMTSSEVLQRPKLSCLELGIIGAWSSKFVSQGSIIGADSAPAQPPRNLLAQHCCLRVVSGICSSLRSSHLADLRTITPRLAAVRPRDRNMRSPSHVVVAAVLAFVCATQAQVLIWPTNGSLNSDIAGQYYDGNAVTIQWSSMSGGPDDLWLATPDWSYHDRVASNIVVSRDGQYEWRIAVGNDALTKQASSPGWQLFFIPTGAPFNSSAVNTYHIGPRVILQKPGEMVGISTSAAPITATFALSSSSGPSATTTLAPDPSMVGNSDTSSSSSDIGGGTLAGIAIGAIVAIVLVLGLLLWALRLRRKVKAATNHRSSGIIPPSGVMPEKYPLPPTPTVKRVSGLHEATGDRRQPIEMEAKRASMNRVHELAS